MGEKPMGSTPDEDEVVDPMAGAAGIITTRSNIKHASSSVAGEGGTASPGSPAGSAGVAGEPIPGIDTKGR